MSHTAPLFGPVWCSSTGDLYHARVCFFFIIILRLFLFFDYIYFLSLGSETSLESSFRRTEIARTAIHHVSSLLMLLLLCLILLFYFILVIVIYSRFSLLMFAAAPRRKRNSCENTYIKTPFNVGTYVHVLN